MKDKLHHLIVPGLLMVPAIASAQFDELDDFIGGAATFINDILIPILLAIAFLVFIAGVVQYLLVAGDDNTESKKKGKNLMLWGIIAFVLIVTIWGIVSLIAEGLGLAGGQNEELQGVPTTPLGN